MVKTRHEIFFTTAGKNADVRDIPSDRRLAAASADLPEWDKFATLTACEGFFLIRFRCRQSRTARTPGGSAGRRGRADSQRPGRV